MGEGRDSHRESITFPLQLEQSLREAELIVRRQIIEVGLGLVLCLAAHAFLRR